MNADSELTDTACYAIRVHVDSWFDMPFYIVILYLCTGITLPLAMLAANRHPARGARALSLFLLCVGESSFCYAMNLSTPDPHLKIFWNHAEYLGGAFLTSLMLVLALIFTDHEKWIRPLPMSLLFFLPILALTANWTNAWHHLYYTRTWLEPSGPFLILCKERGLMYLIYFLHVYVVAGFALVLIARTLRRPRGTTRTQLTLLLSAFLIPLLLNLPYLLRIMPHRHIDLTLLGFFISSLIISLAMFRYRLLSTMEIEQQIKLQELNAKLINLIARREEELREAIQETLTAAESEARRIGEDIHDGLCQELVGLVRLTENVERDFSAESESSHCTLAMIREQSVRLAGIARTLSHDLTFHELDILTLPEALDSLARRTEQLFHAEFEITMSNDVDTLTREQTIHLYRLIREAVANAVKHAHAQHIWIDMIQESDQLVISITNDGTPIPDESQRINGLGMRQMHMRVRLLDGTLFIGCDPQNKTVVQATVPLHRKETT